MSRTSIARHSSIVLASSASANSRHAGTSADSAFINQGITFSVYSDRRGTEKIFPFDLIPRTIPASEWEKLEAGLVQRIRALNLFLHDVYHDQRILKEKVVPADLVLGSKGFRNGDDRVRAAGRSYIHICGTDLIRETAGSSWCSRTTAGRRRASVTSSKTATVMKKVFPHLFQDIRVRRVEDYPHRLREALASVAPAGAGSPPCVVVLSPGPYNSAYFEHSFLARHMGVELVLGQDCSCTTTSFT